MLINPIELIVNDEYAKIQSSIEYANKKETLWYSVPNKYREYLTTEKLDGFVVGVLLKAMELGEDIVVRGSMSEKLFYNLTHYYRKILQLQIPSLKQINILPDSLDDGKTYSTQGAVGTGFSAGVDSLSTIYDHFLTDIPPHYKITHFTFHNVGAHGEWHPENAAVLFNTRYEKTRVLTEQLGIDLIKIDSNLSDFLKMDFRRTHTTRNLSCPLMLQKLFSKFYYSNVFRYQDSFIGDSKNMATAGFAAVHLLSTETLDLIISGCQYSRVEKTKKIAAHGVSQWLSPCVSPDPETGENCSQCWKCSVVLFTLELHGLLDKFEGTFDLNKWKRVRNTFIFRTVLTDHSDPLYEELREYARDTGYRFTLGQKILAKLYLLYRPMPLPLKKVLRFFYSLVSRTPANLDPSFPDEI
jgi:hypothetical protein